MSDHISICVCTYHRNSMLARLLRNLASQQTGGLFTYSVVVIDNDPAGPARAEVGRLSSELSMEIEYDVEPEKSIPAARNRAIRLAKGNFIGIIDDDEFPSPHWLLTLFEAVRTFEVDGALGPIIPFFEQHPPAWALGGGLYELPQWRTGTLLRWNQTRTGNVLLKKNVFDQNGICFDETFKTGGSDQAFFRHAMELGFRFIAADEAQVFETVPPERWSKSYFVRRALVNGYNAQKYLAKENNRLKSTAAFLKSAVALSAYTISAPACACMGTQIFVRCLERGFYHLSRLAAVFGIEMWKKRDF
jgi:succinoglycan biosynthesis protein ExoM